jgi:hypothetical protein
MKFEHGACLGGSSRDPSIAIHLICSDSTLFHISRILVVDRDRR